MASATAQSLAAAPSVGHGHATPTVSVLLPTKNAGPLLERVLLGVRSQRTSFAFEIIAVDSGSSDQTIATLRAHGVRTISIPPEAFTHGGTRNLLARIAKGDYLVFLTQDAVPADDQWLQQLVEPLVYPKVAATYARQVPRANTDPVQAFFLAQMYPETSRLQFLNGKGITRSEIHFSNASSAIRRDIWRQIPFRSDLIMAEDQDWSLRVLTQGYKIHYVSDARVEHAHDFTLGAGFRRFFDSGVCYREIYRHSGRRESFSLPFLGAGLRHLVLEIVTLIRGRQFRWIPRALVDAAVKGTAVLLGRNHRLLPLWLKRRLSYHKALWAEARILGGPQGAAGTLSATHR